MSLDKGMDDSRKPDLVRQRSVSRRKFASTIASVGIPITLSGCGSVGGGTEAPTVSASPTNTEAPTDTVAGTEPSDGKSDTETAISGTSTNGLDEVTAVEPTDGMLDTVGKYKYVTENTDAWMGQQISCPQVTYMQTFGDYLVFRAIEYEYTMPFLIATDEGEETANGWSFTGTFGGTQTIDGHEVIVVEDATVTALGSE